jgi:hypothetical protein
VKSELRVGVIRRAWLVALAAYSLSREKACGAVRDTTKAKKAVRGTSSLESYSTTQLATIVAALKTKHLFDAFTYKNLEK